MHRDTQWELFWMVFHGQSRAVTFHNLIRLGLGACRAMEEIRDAFGEEDPPDRGDAWTGGFAANH